VSRPVGGESEGSSDGDTNGRWEKRMHVITVRRRTTAGPEAIWKLWQDVPSRIQWDDSLQYARLDGPFRAGAVGVAKLKDQPERRFEVLQCIPPRMYTDRFFLPMGSKMDWLHTVSDVDEDHDVTFDVSVHGPTSLILAPILKRILMRALPPTVDKLIVLAERG
jgi:hypothetical protein